MKILLPRLLKRFQRQAEELISLELVKDIQFSGSTYQIRVDDPVTAKENWAFLQLDEQGRLKDSFCSCTENEDSHGCMHQAAAFVTIYAGFDLPLHLRFQRSLWNQLGLQGTALIGGDSKKLKVLDEGHYSYTVRGKTLFSIHALTPASKARLIEILFERPEETEETSLKFSNLSSEEILSWEQGRPSLQLSYELSFWNDLAKWLMQMQEIQHLYTISFQYSPKNIPQRLMVEFSEMSLEFHLSLEALESIIPSLATVKSPLIVHSAWKEVIEKIVYDQAKKCFIITPRKHQEDLHVRLKRAKAVDIGDWAYVVGDGFYSKQPHFLFDVTEFHDVETILNEHSHEMKGLIEGSIIKESPSGVSYTVTFDKDWNLHIQSYLFAPGDLGMPGSCLYGCWAYINDKGFYRLEAHDFPDVETFISCDQVGDFVSEHRPWFNTQKEFSTHLTSLDSELGYQLNADNYLTFNRQASFINEEAKSKDFGRWIYAAGHGFFSKGTTHRMPIKVDFPISPGQIPLFIRMNREELHFVRNFFSSKCPVEKVELNIQLLSPQQISVNPEYKLLPQYADRKVHFFDDVVYVEGEGFHELMLDKRLPEGFGSAVIIDKDDLESFLTTKLDKLLPFASYVDPRVRKPSQSYLVAEEIQPQDAKGKEGYGLKLDFKTEHGTISLSSLWWALQQNQRYVFSEAGMFDLSDQRFSWLKGVSKGRMDRKRNMLNLPTLEVLRLNALEGITAAPDKEGTYQHTLQLLRDLTEFRVPDDPDLTGLKSHLRPYQLLGVRWLWFLYHHGLSGLLCDDMGLGKTHQTMALLMAITNYWRAKDPETKRHFLIVCPTSVIYHWQEKLAEFLPSLRVGTFYGINRSLDRFYNDCDILLTSYGVWRNEVEVLGKLNFEVAVFDELQIAKNHLSRIFRALLKAKARMRLGLTGTPIENRLRELKTLFDIVLPTYMPAESEYRDFFVKPIERELNPERRLLLSRLIKPFVLRRKKEDVLLDLPEKIEQISHCDLLPQQCELYVDVLSASREKLIEELKNESTPIPFLHIFALLSQLKQICNHPAVYLKKASEYKNYLSGKWELFLELLEEARESQQKVVVFSQYLSMLDIIESYLNEHNIGYASIRGKTQNRGEQLHRFNTDPECEVFVASLQAAGLGVDLTAASVVIHYDRWWNAARENQATDRVHRIGQTRGVQVFKLMTKGSIEEHIDFLINKKGRLMEDIVSVDDHQMIKKFDRQQMISLLQIMPKINKGN